MNAATQSNGQFYTLSREHGCAILQIATPEVTNVLSTKVIASLHRAVEILREEAERGQIKGLIITGNDKFFSAGADLKEISKLSAAEAFEFSRRGQRLTDEIDKFPVPVIAAIRGYCMGGAMDLSLSCDYRIASPDAVFGHRGASLGVITGWGGTQRLPRLIGKPRALQMFLLAEMVSAEEAKSIGLVNEIAPDPLRKALNRISQVLQNVMS